MTTRDKGESTLINAKMKKLSEDNIRELFCCWLSLLAEKIYDFHLNLRGQLEPKRKICIAL